MKTRGRNICPLVMSSTVVTLLVRLTLLSLTALSYTAAAAATSTEPQDPTSTSDPVIASCSDDPVLEEGKNEPEIIWGNGQYTGRQELNVLKHLKTPEGPKAPKEWQFWMTDYTKNCSHVHFYPYGYKYGSGAEVPLFTGKFPKPGESIGDGKPYKGLCCSPNSELPNQNALTVGVDVLAGINKVYAFNEKYYKINGKEMNGVDEWSTPIEAFTLNNGKKTASTINASYHPSEPNEKGVYDQDHPLSHSITFYISNLISSMDYYRSRTAMETVTHELRHATQFSTWFDADASKISDWSYEEAALREDFAYLYEFAVKNWFKSDEGSTLCGSNPCIWTKAEEYNPSGTPNVDLNDPNNDNSGIPYIYSNSAVRQKRAMIAAYAFYAASQGMKKCAVANPTTDYVTCPAGTNAFIDGDFAGLGIDTAFKIFGYVDQEFEPFYIDYRATKGLSLYKADREWPAKDQETGKYLSKETSDTYKVFANAFQAANIPSKSPKPLLELEASESVVNSTVDLNVSTGAWCQDNYRNNLRIYADGELLNDEQGQPIDIDFQVCQNPNGHGWKTFKWSNLPVKITDEVGSPKPSVELDVVFWDIDGAHRIVSSKTIPVKDPNVKPPQITFDHPSGESPDSSSSDPVYKARLEVEASEGVLLNPDGAYFVLDTGVEQINVEVSEACPQVSDKEIVCDTEFKADSRYNEAEGNVQDPYDGGTAYDEGEHQDHAAGVSYVEYGSSDGGAPE